MPAPTPTTASPISWSQLVGHHAQIEMLRRAAERGRLGHTLLFAGPHGIGKQQVALLVAQSLFCERHTNTELAACGVCSACRQVAALTHPDLIVVRRPPGKAVLPIALFVGEDETRGKEGMCHELSLRPMSASRRVAIIDEAELMGDEAANALLKTLEEPPPHSLIILLADAPESLLTTIRSRCQVLRFQPLSVAEVAELLQRQEPDRDRASILAAAELSGGNLITAQTLLDPGLRSLREVIRTGFDAPLYNSVALGKTIWEQIEELARDTATQRVVAQWVIRFAAEWHQQVLSLIAGKEVTGRAPRLPPGFVAGDGVSLDRAGDLLARCLAAEPQIDGNATVWLVLESLLDDVGRMRREGVVDQKSASAVRTR